MRLWNLSRRAQELDAAIWGLELRILAVLMQRQICEQEKFLVSPLVEPTRIH